jgi:hypothetical protein
MTTYEFEEQDKSVLVDQIQRITEVAVEAGRFFSVRMSKTGDWWKAVVTVGEAA